MSDKKFEYSYTAPSEEERAEIERIRDRYVAPERGIDELRRLDKKVKAPATALAVTAGVIGVLVFGLGLSMVLSWGLMWGGSVVSLVGAALAASAYAIFNAAFKRRKAKYADEIVKLSQKLLDGDDGRDDGKISLTK